MRIYLVLMSSFAFSCQNSTISDPQSGALPPNEVRARVISVDLDSGTVRADILASGKALSDEWGRSSGMEIKFLAQPGDLNLLAQKEIFRGSSNLTFSPSEGSIHSLSNIWPDDLAERIRLNNVNRLLRRDTLSLGDSLIRSVGDSLPPFALYDQDGAIITTDYFDGSVTILNFIFTRCSVAEMCPASTMRMKKLQQLAQSTKVSHVKFLSITLDPEFDTPGVLKSYARAYDLNESNFRLGTASKGVISDLTRQFGILRKNDKGIPLDHTMRTMIVNSKRQIIYQFPGSHWAVEDFLSRLPEGLQG